MRKHTILYLLISLAVLLVSCDDYLNVAPKDEMSAGQMFASEDGFYSVLAGIYNKMGEQSFYGKAMTISQMEVMGNTFSIATPAVISAYPSLYQYPGLVLYLTDRETRYTGLETFFTNYWTVAYNAITNINTLLSYIEKESSASLFPAGAKDLLQGEALALRAYIHFDLLRLFQPPYMTEEGKSSKRIPYMEKSGYEFVPSSSSDEIMDKIIKDLKLAAGMMKETDPISSSSSYDASIFKSNRHYKMNYYAVLSLLSRVYLYKGMYAEAYETAMEVIGAEASMGVRFVNAEDLQQKDSAGDYILRSCPMENIFGLLVDKLGSYAYTDRYTGYTFFERFRLIPARYSSYYSNPSDKRITLWKKGSSTSNTYFYKYERPSKESDLKLYPKPTVSMLKLGEIYLIAAEAAAEAVSTTEALRLLNYLQEKRGSVIFDSVDKEEILQEILKEYRREMIGDGQMFFAYKRRNISQIEKGYSTSGTEEMSVEKYTPDIPADEFNGGRTY